MKSGAKNASLVLNGSFNPSIFHPQWFADQEIISKGEADTAIEAADAVTSSQVTAHVFTWGNLQVTTEKFILICFNEAFFDALQDFVVKTFETLIYTPLTAVGINLEQKFTSGDRAQHKGFGDNLAPKDSWDFMSKPGLLDLTMRGSRESKEPVGYVNARVRSDGSDHGIVIGINDHYYIVDYQPISGARPILDILTSEWNDSRARSENYIEKIIENFQ